VLDYLVSKANACIVGDQFEESTKMGPLANKNQLNKVLDYVKLGQEEGAKLQSDANFHDSDRKGYYIKPVIFSNVTPDMRIFQEEIFGPVLCVTKFTSDEEALELANNTDYGLAAGIWTENLNRTMHFTKALKSGMVWVNTYSSVDPSLPFGGVKQSGFGRELGEASVNEYTQLKTVWINH